jgi:hypothetical protein
MHRFDGPSFLARAAALTTAVSALVLAATVSFAPPASATWLATGNPVCTESHVQSSP